MLCASRAKDKLKRRKKTEKEQEVGISALQITTPLALILYYPDYINGEKRRINM